MINKITTEAREKLEELYNEVFNICLNTSLELKGYTLYSLKESLNLTPTDYCTDNYFINYNNGYYYKYCFVNRDKETEGLIINSVYKTTDKEEIIAYLIWSITISDIMSEIQEKFNNHSIIKWATQVHCSDNLEIKKNNAIEVFYYQMKNELEQEILEFDAEIVNKAEEHLEKCKSETLQVKQFNVENIEELFNEEYWQKLKEVQSK